MQGRKSAVLGGGKSRKGSGKSSLHYLRSIIFIALVVIWTLLLSPAVPVLWLANAASANVRAVAQIWAHGIVWLFKYVIGLDYREQGRENIPPGPCMIACNHQSLWETAV